MVREKIKRKYEGREIIYEEGRWRLLHELREKALNIIYLLEKGGIKAFAHGSIARGDVNRKSDVDIVILEPVASYKVEISLENLQNNFYSKRIVQATPNSVIKAHIDIDEKTTVTFPLIKLSTTEYEFYIFGGLINLEEIKGNVRKPGVDKRLVYIEPTLNGHIEYSIIGREAETAKKLGISVETIKERKKVLLRRDRLGRTGVFLNKKLREHESFEEALEKIASKKPEVRRKLFKQKK